MKEHIPECPTGRDRDHLCICETLRMVRAAARTDKARRERDEHHLNSNSVRRVPSGSAY